jgi:alanine racemase
MPEKQWLNWVEVDGRALRWNLEQFRERLGEEVRLAPVVKSNAYGHGLLEVAGLAVESGVEWLCVNSLEEAVRLREAGHRDVRIMVMGHVALDQLEAVVDHRLRPVIVNIESLDILERVAGERGWEVPVHLKLETGTNRQGIPESEIGEFAFRLRQSPSLRLEGLATHFANIEDTTVHGFAEEQFDTFTRAAAALREAGHEIPVMHTACSAAALLFTRTHLDLARIGIAMYGLWPSKETYVSCLELDKPTLSLRPVMTWKSRVAQVRQVAEGRFIGYGCTFRTTRESRIALLPVGYYEGYDRGLSGMGHVLIRGKRAPIRGRVCMNMCMADVTDIPGVSLQDEVVLLGRQGDEELSAEQLATWCGTISYEIVSRINPTLPRIVK